MSQVMFYEVFEEEKQAIETFLPGHIQAQYTDKTIQESQDVLPPAQIISVRTQSCIPVDWAPNIKAILTRSQGYDHLLAFQQEAKGNVVCGCLGEYCSRAVAEQAVLAMLFLLRKMPAQIRQFQNFQRDGLTGRESFGKKVLVIGVGNIGTEIVDIVKGLRMMVKGVDIDPRLPEFEYVSLPEGLKWAEVVFCALPLTEVTQKLLNFEVLSGVAKGLIFINISRGEISPIKDLEHLLAEGILGAIHLDVYDEEKELAEQLRKTPLQRDQERISDYAQRVLKLSKKENVLFTPHNAFNTQEALENKARLSAESVEKFLKEGYFPHMVLGK